ncbi:MarR family transcriptional regulator [Dysosmobacter sp.]|uniref:MarR family transcriptional regulator n=1 Tax=Dysosmobacter sp. TaxID=2591382 RepID=UPI002A9A2D7E|nr:helix-turn-helix domain-containing protein [Dysosmobacter sp.]MDY5509704.1 helix-turn-helix domain-containing protein [Dysosmobacter sp.]
MTEYQLELKQIVDYPRCRIYRQFIQTLITDRSIRTNNGGSGLFYFTVLCSYANFRTSYRRLDGISYTIYPGEWICSMSEMAQWFRCRTKGRALDILLMLQEAHLVQYTVLGRGRLVKYRIMDWRRHNTVLDYNCPCQKDVGFFFLPVSTATELVSFGKCSDMDILLDLWISAVYNDQRVQGSFSGPVAYFRDGSGCPLVSYTDLALRWGISKATVGRTLKKLAKQGHISLLTFPGRHGTAIYLQNYLSTMFQISDVMVDKEEVALSLNIKLAPQESGAADAEQSAGSVSEGAVIVSEPAEGQIAQRVLQILALQGISCGACPRCSYKLYPLSGDGEGMLEGCSAAQRFFHMEVCCHSGRPIYVFELSTRAVDALEEGGCANG